MKIEKLIAAAALALATACPMYAEPVTDVATRPAQPAAPAPTVADPAEEIKLLRARLDQLEVQQAKLAQQKDVQKTSQEMIEDARRHSMLIDSTGVTSGFSIQKGFFISSEDQAFYLHPGVTFQFRGVANHLENAKAGGSADTTTGFEVRRAKFNFEGGFGKDISFRLQWQDSNNGGAPTLEYGWMQLMLMRSFAGGNLAVRAGQFKDIVFKEETTGDEQQLMVERSLLNTLLGGGAVGPLVQGVNFIYGGDQPLRAQLMIEDGARTGNTDFTNTLSTTTVTPPGLTTTTSQHVNFGVAGRVDYKLFGNWGDASDFTGVWGKQDLLIIGGGVDFTQSDNTNAVRWTADAQYQMTKRLSIVANVNGAFVDLRNTAGPDQRTDIGAQVEGGYFLKPNFQLVARYAVIKFDDDFKTGGEDTFHEISAGFNYFLGENGSYGNRAKISVDVTYLPNGTPAALGNDFRASPNGKDEFVGRAQLQLWL